ncbi:MAG: DNA methyltransferase [Gammaproteobacteria bacterium]|nr:DNA methyltransferase [Gammaproteobacteria bacterium]
MNSLPFPDKKYQVILADPPWQYSDSANAGKRGAVHKYEVMDLQSLCDLPVADIADENCVLFMWVTPPFLEDCFQVAKAWGFTYKTKAFCWIKHTEKAKEHFGMGNWTRANSEDCLLFTKGKPKRVNASVRQVIRSRVLQHSVKPPVTRNHICQLMGDIPRIELFARQKVEGWDYWGSEVLE